MGIFEPNSLEKSATHRISGPHLLGNTVEEKNGLQILRSLRDKGEGDGAEASAITSKAAQHNDSELNSKEISEEREH